MNRDILNKIQAIISDPNRIDEVSYGELSEWEESLPFYQPLKYLLHLKANKLGIRRQQQAHTTAAYLSQEIEFTHSTDNHPEPIDHELASDDLESIVPDEVTEAIDHTQFRSLQNFDENSLNNKIKDKSNIDNISQSMDNELEVHEESSVLESNKDIASIEDDSSIMEFCSLPNAEDTVESEESSSSLENYEEERVERIATQAIQEEERVESSVDGTDSTTKDTNNINKENKIDDVPSLITTSPKIKLVDNSGDQHLQESKSIDSVDTIIDNLEDTKSVESEENSFSEVVIESDGLADNNSAKIDIIEQSDKFDEVKEDDVPVIHSPILATTGIESIKKEDVPSAYSKENEIDEEEVDVKRDKQKISAIKDEELTNHKQIFIDDSLESDDVEKLSEFTLWLKSTKREKAKDTKRKKKKKKVGTKKDKKKKEKPKKKKKSSKKVIEDANRSNYRDNSIISETLADILASQGHNSEADKMYNQLSLLFPEKSDYFAAKIKNLKNNS